MTSEDNKPKWDIALASLAKDAYGRKAAPLKLEDFHDLAREHSIRLDDIMETVLLLTIHGQWKYCDAAGQEQKLDQETLDGLYVKRRLSEKDLSVFNGGWQPV